MFLCGFGTRRYAEEGLGTTQMCCVGAIKAEGPFVRSRLFCFFNLEV